MRRVGALVAAVVLLGACGGGAPSRSSVLGDLADDFIVPAYQQFQTDSAELADAVAELCESPDSTSLSEAHNALASARDSWSRTEAAWVGPVMDRRSWGLVRWPVANDEIEELIADTSIELDYEWLSSRIGADQRGLGGVEYVLGAGDESLESLTDPRRCAYLKSVVSVIANEADGLVDDWTASSEVGDPYRDLFADPENGGVDSVVNDTLFLLEAITDLELGNALGAMSRDADPEAVDEGPARAGVDDLRERLVGARAVLVGLGESQEGLSPLLGDELAARLAGQFHAAFDAVDEIQPPLRQAVAHSPESVIRARDAIKALQITVATEVVSRLGVVIGFSDADGDSAG